MNFVSPPMTHSIISDRTRQAHTIMTTSAFNFLCDTLYEEIKDHPHRYELMQLMEEQVADDT